MPLVSRFIVPMQPSILAFLLVGIRYDNKYDNCTRCMTSSFVPQSVYCTSYELSVSDITSVRHPQIGYSGVVPMTTTTHILLRHTYHSSQVLSGYEPRNLLLEPTVSFSCYRISVSTSCRTVSHLPTPSLCTPQCIYTSHRALTPPCSQVKTIVLQLTENKCRLTTQSSCAIYNFSKILYVNPSTFLYGSLLSDNRIIVSGSFLIDDEVFISTTPEALKETPSPQKGLVYFFPDLERFKPNY